MADNACSASEVDHFPKPTLRISSPPRFLSNLMSTPGGDHCPPHFDTWIPLDRPSSVRLDSGEEWKAGLSYWCNSITTTTSVVSLLQHQPCGATPSPTALWCSSVSTTSLV
ncbi:unnamed protein product [Arctogadus glacialis]